MSAIRQMMATEMVTATPEEMVADVARRMSGSHVGAVMVVEGGKLVGLFSERDLLQRVVGEGLAPAAVRVGDVATREVFTVDVDQPVREVLRLFRERRVRHLPVLANGAPAGILSTRDLLERSVEALEHFIESGAYGNELKEGADPYDHFGGAYQRR